MAPRNPARPKTADLEDVDVLDAVAAYSSGGLFVTDAFPWLPPKLVVSKLRKLQKRGLVTNEGGRYSLTQAGREAIAA